MAVIDKNTGLPIFKAVQKKDPATYSKKNVSGTRRLQSSDLVVLPKNIGSPIIFKDSSLVASGSRLDRYWNTKFARAILAKSGGKCLRPPKTLNIYDPVSVSKFFNLRAIEYGNWLNIEDRLNYTAAIALAMYDMAIILRIPPSKMGFNGKLTHALGSRGLPGSAAHYSPSTKLINTNRFRQTKTENKVSAMYNSGGSGSFGHEYGHAFDDLMGQPTGWSSTSTGLRAGSSKSQKIMNQILTTIIWENPKTKTQTSYYKKLKSRSPYWRKRAELMARSFEQYLSHKTKQKGCTNQFLIKTKYKSDAYLPPLLLKKVIPLYDKWMVEVRKKLK